LVIVVVGDVVAAVVGNGYDHPPAAAANDD
jgi:hypothetical protein